MNMTKEANGQQTQENFIPVANVRGTARCARLLYYLRMIVDLQLLSIYRDLKRLLPNVSGSILDVGCGQSPYRFLLPSGCEYQGIDIVDADKFGYQNAESIPFDGKHIPFENESFDAILCTEVLEHVFQYQQLVDEMHRVLKTGGTAILTIPWSARFHYIPHDYHRLTPSAIGIMVSVFREWHINPRGTDITVIANKLIVLIASSIKLRSIRSVLVLLVLIALSPVVLVWLIFAHVSLPLNLGSTLDPLGYTIVVRK